MLDLIHARQVFEKYLEQFDREDEKIKLKIVHTEGVIRCAQDICRRMNLSEEDCRLAELIALLHDIGRFEQVRLYDSFEPTVMDHAASERRRWITGFPILHISLISTIRKHVRLFWKIIMWRRL